MLGVLIVVSGLFAYLLLIITLERSIEYLAQSEILDLGNYTRAYRCKGCNAIYSRDQAICGKCGCEKEMVGEIGKWHCTISKLRPVYYWERKNVQM